MILKYDNYNLEVKDISTDDKVRFDVKYYVGYNEKISISISFQ